MMGALDKGRVEIAALAIGIAQAGLEAALGYAATRRQFGRAIGESQGLQWMLADMAQGIQAARRLTHDAAARLDAGADAANAVQLFGGSGYIRRFEVERLYRDAKICQIYEGTQQVQRTITARELIKRGTGGTVR